MLILSHLENCKRFANDGKCQCNVVYSIKNGKVEFVGFAQASTSLQEFERVMSSDKFERSNNQPVCKKCESPSTCDGELCFGCFSGIQR